MKTSREFEKLYLNREFISSEPYFEKPKNEIPCSSPFSDLINGILGKDSKKKEASALQRPKLRTLSNIALTRHSEDQLYVALFELISAHLLARQLLRKKNRRFSAQRKSCIKHLGSVLKYERLSPKCRDVVETELKHLVTLGKEKPTYQPLNELDYLSLYFKEAEANIKCLEMELQFSQFKKGNSVLPSTEKEMIAAHAAHKKIKEKLSKYENQPMKFKGTKPPQFFFKALKNVVFILLHEKNKIAKEKSKELAANIINEYLDKDPHKIVKLNTRIKFKTLTSRDIDNALRDSS